MPELPTGTVTFLFTDIEGSTRLLKRLGDRYADALAQHQRLLRAAIQESEGHEIDTQGDAFFVAFRRAKDAVTAALAAQTALASHPWPNGEPVRVRMGIHTAEPAVGGERYVGLGVHRAARVCAAGHGGQVLVSGATRELVEEELPPGIELRALGEHRLKDLDRPEHIFQLVGDGLGTDFPPLKTLAAQPVAATPFAGREGELAAAAEAAVAPPRFGRRRLMWALGSLLAAAVIAVTAFMLTGSQPGLADVPPDAVGVIDPASNKIIDAVGVNESPGPISVSGNSVWVLNQNSRTASRIDSRTRKVVDNFGIAEQRPSGFAADGDDGVFLSSPMTGTLGWNGSNGLSTSIEIGDENVVGAGIALAVEGGGVWVLNQRPSALIRVDSTVLLSVVEQTRLEHEPSALAVGRGFVWIANQDGTVSRFDPVSKEANTIPAGDRTGAISLGPGGLWVLVGRRVARLSLEGFRVVKTVGVGRDPIALAVGKDDVWVADAADGTVMRIDARTGSVKATIPVGHRPQGIAVANGLVWVTVRR
jgi:YVTN family beta-propeller protein